MIQGPNIKKLIIHKMSMIAVPKGAGIGDALNFMTKPGAIGNAAKEATEWIENALKAIRLADDPNPWRDATDEEIAGHLLREIDSKMASRKLLAVSQAIQDAQYDIGHIPKKAP